MKKYAVHIISDAKQDLIEIYDYISKTDSIARADSVLNKIEELCFSLEHFPERGHVPEELRRLAIMDYREVHFKPYRIFYQQTEKIIYIHCILDGRRDLESLLTRRLLRA